MELLEGMIESGCEGNIGWFENRQIKMLELITELKPKNLIEIGFNIGHSALLICEKIKNLKRENSEYNLVEINFYIFDICVCDATKPNFEVLKAYYKEFLNLHLIEGSSLETITPFMNSKNILFDFIEIDGCHTYECLQQDLKNTVNFLSKNGVIYIDDYKSSQYPLKQVDNGVDDFNWQDFEIDFIDGVFWAKNKVNCGEMVNNPEHYGGATNPYEAIKVIDAWDLGFCLGNTVKYISRAGKKHKDKELEDLKKALWYLQHHIETLENK
jgi:predicted O-methyltransferase YrrM